MTIKTEEIYPPIPIRCYDWRAYIDGREDGPFGWGSTEEEAIAELKAEIEDSGECSHGDSRPWGHRGFRECTDCGHIWDPEE